MTVRTTISVLAALVALSTSLAACTAQSVPLEAEGTTTAALPYGFRGMCPNGTPTKVVGGLAGIPVAKLPTSYSYATPTPYQTAGSAGTCAQALVNHGCSTTVYRSPIIDFNTGKVVGHELSTSCATGTMSALQGLDYGTFPHYAGWVWYGNTWAWIDTYTLTYSSVNGVFGQYGQLWTWNGTTFTWAAYINPTWTGYVYQPCSGGEAQGVSATSHTYFTGGQATDAQPECPRTTEYPASGKEFDDFDPRPCGGTCE